MPEWLAGALTGGGISLFSALLAGWMFRRKTADAVAEDLLVKTNDEIRDVFVRNESNFKQYTIRFFLGDKREYLVSRIIQIGSGTVLLDVMQIVDDVPVWRGQALYRFSAIQAINDLDRNRHADKAANSAKDKFP